MTDKLIIFLAKCFTAFFLVSSISYADTKVLSPSLKTNISIVSNDHSVMPAQSNKIFLKSINKHADKPKVKMGVAFSAEDLYRVAKFEPFADYIEEDSGRILGFYIKTNF